MRTIQQINTEIIEQLDILGAHKAAEEAKDKDKSLTKTQLSRVKSRIEYLKQMQSYLQTSPNQEFLTTQLAAIVRRMDLIVSSYDGKAHGPIKKYKESLEYPELEKRKKTLEYLLTT